MFEEAGHAFEAQGIKVRQGDHRRAEHDRPQGQAWSNQLTAGIKGLFKKNKVTFLAGHGSFVGQGRRLLEGQGWR